MAHIGVVRALESEGIVIAAVAGTSIGAAVGGIVAAGELDAYEARMREMTRKSVIALLDPVIPRSGLFAGVRISQLMRSILGDLRIEDLKIPFAAVAAGLENGEEIWLREGDLVEAMRASSSIPGLFTPVRYGGRWLVDGGVASPVPFAAASALADLPVIAVDVNDQTQGQPADLPTPTTPTANPEPAQPSKLERILAARELHPRLREFAESARASGNAASERIASEMRRLRDRIRATPTEQPPRAPGMIESLTETLIALQHQLASCQRQLTPPELMIIPHMKGVGLFDFHRTPELIAEGERAARAALGISANQPA
jgi:NTE family protein